MVSEVFTIRVNNDKEKQFLKAALEDFRTLDKKMDNWTFVGLNPLIMDCIEKGLEQQAKEIIFNNEKVSYHRVSCDYSRLGTKTANIIFNVDRNCTLKELYNAEDSIKKFYYDKYEERCTGTYFIKTLDTEEPYIKVEIPLEAFIDVTDHLVVGEDGKETLEFLNVYATRSFKMDEFDSSVDVALDKIYSEEDSKKKPKKKNKK